MRSTTLAVLIVCAVALLALGGCKSSKKKTPETTATDTVQAVSSAEPVSTPITPESTPSGEIQGKLIGVEIMNEGDHDHVVFTFDSTVATPHVDFTEAHDCASGAPVAMAGQAFLEIRFDHTIAHEQDGSPSVHETDMQTNLPSILEARQTCDYEGVVSWTLGLPTVALNIDRGTEPGATFSIDIAHP